MVLTLTSPDGEAVANRTVQLFADGFPFESHDTIRLTGQTDANGQIHVDWWQGVYRLIAKVPGVGYGSTGYFEVLAGETEAVTLPPLARFGVIEGRVDGDHRNLDIKVSEDSQDHSLFTSGRQLPPAWVATGRPVEVRTDGTFTIQDLIPWTCRLSYTDTIDVAYVRPGEVTHVVVTPKTPETSEPVVVEASSSDRKKPRRQRTASVSGVLRDHDGRPLSGQSVVILEESNWRRGTPGHSCVTAEDGSYQFTDLGYPAREIFLVVAVPDRPPVVQRVRSTDIKGVKLLTKGGDDQHSETGTLRAQQASVESEVVQYRRDVTLSPSGGTLEVQVLPSFAESTGGGFDASGSSHAPAVALIGPRDVPPLHIADIDERPEPFRSTFRRLCPYRRVGGDGIARFDHLAPGRYDIALLFNTNDEDLEREWDFAWLGSHYEKVAYRNIGVAVGEVRRIKVMPERRCELLRLEVRDAAGTRDILDGHWGWGVKQAPSQAFIESSTSSEMSFVPRKPGLWNVLARKRHSEVVKNTEKYGLYFEAGTRVAASSLLPERNVRVNASRLDAEDQSLTVHLRDQHGQPVPGTVLLSWHFAATAKNGMAVFRGLPFYAAHSMIAGFVTNRPRPPVPEIGMADDPLTGHVYVAPTMLFDKLSQPREVTLHEQPVSYVRCELRLPEGASIEDYWVSIYGSRNTDSYGQVIDPESSTVLAGAFWGEKAHVSVMRDLRSLVKESFPLEPGKVTRIAVDVPEAEPPVTNGPTEVDTKQDRSQSQIYNPDDLVTIHVRHSDGTPARNASVYYLHPKATQATVEATTDSEGRCQFDARVWRLQWKRKVAAENNDLAYTIISSGGPLTPVQIDDNPLTHPMLLASVPGSHGYTYLGITQALSEKHAFELTLPAALTIAGRVAIDGQPGPLKRAFAGTLIKVEASYRGLENLGRQFSLSQTVAADGTFRLEGLTPGIYDVQASIDDVWLSKTITLNIPEVPDDTAKEIVLPIGMPGSAAFVQLLNKADNSPLAHATVNVQFPSGPRAERTHTEPLKTDGLGIVRIDGCTAGRHILQIYGQPRRILFNVPPYDRPNDTVQKINVVVDP